MFSFSEILLSTITIEAKLSNVYFNEQNLTNKLIPNDRVIIIGSNFCEKHFYEPVKTEESIKKKRGRKPREPTLPTRVLQGSGKYMNSQITFVTTSLKIPGKVYKIKVFRNGTIQIPGVIHNDFTDIRDAIVQTRNVLANCLGDSVQICNTSENTEFIIIMRNLKWRISNPGWMLLLDKLATCLRNYSDKTRIELIANFIRFNPERYQGITFKIRPANSNIGVKKSPTFKVFRSGKINMTSRLSMDDTNILINWFLDFINQNWESFMTRLIYIKDARCPASKIDKTTPKETPETKVPAGVLLP